MNDLDKRWADFWMQKKREGKWRAIENNCLCKADGLFCPACKEKLK